MSTIDNTKQAGLFSTPLGQRIYGSFLEAASDFSMDASIRHGVLVGLSAGDTVKAVILRSYGFGYRQYEVTLTAYELFS